MSNIFSFITCDGNSYSSSFTVLPLTFPNTAGPVVITGDPIYYTSAPQSLPLTPNNYKVEVNSQATNNWYVDISGSIVSPISVPWSVTGSMANVLFDLQNTIGQQITASSVDITPVYKNVTFNNNFVLSDTRNFPIANNTGITISLIPMPYFVTYYGPMRNTKFQILPSGSCTASACLVTGYTKVNVPQPQNQSQFAYTTMASDERYMPLGGILSGSNQIYLQSTDGNTYTVGLVNNGGSQYLQVGQNPTVGVTGFVNIGSVSGISSSYALTASYAQNGGGGSSFNGTSSLFGTASWATYVVNGSTYNMTSSIFGTSSWASNAVSASYASSSPATTLFTASTYPITSSWTNNILGGNVKGYVANAYTASVVGISTATNSTNYSVVFVTSSASPETLWIDNSNQVTFNPGTHTLTVTNITASLFGTSSWSTNAVNATNAGYATTAGAASTATSATNSTNAISASYLSGSATASLFGTASWAISASYAPGSSGGTTLYTGSTYPITSSWANTSSVAISASYAPGSSAATYTSSLFGTASWATNVVNGSTYNMTSSIFGTASWAQHDLTSSYISSSATFDTATSYTLTASWANNATNAVNAFLTANSGTGPDNIVYAGGSSGNQGLLANSSILVYPSAGGIAAKSFTGSSATIAFSGTASNAISASYAPGSSAATYTSSLFGTASWANNAVSASYASSSPATTLSTGSTYSITSSWTNNILGSNVNGAVANATTASVVGISTATNSTNYSIVFVTSSASPETLWIDNSNQVTFNPGTHTLTVPNITASLFGTGSWSTNAIAAVTSSNGIVSNTATNQTFYFDLSPSSSTGVWPTYANASLTYNPGTTTLTVPTVVASLTGTSSWATNAISASYAPGSSGGTTLYTGSTYPITSSWATNVVNGSTYNMTSSIFGTASWAQHDLTSSYISSSATFDTGASYTLTASWANSSQTSSYISPYTTYYTNTTSSTNWITCSFINSYQYVTLGLSGSYSFTQSNMPSSGQIANILMIVSHSVTNSTSSLKFPSSWTYLGSGSSWPTSITSSQVATMWLAGIGTNMILGTFVT